jgi:ECF transporter S component (folate family)
MSEKAKLSYASPFSRAYWAQAVRQVGNLRMLTVAAVLAALHVVVSGFYIPLGDNLHVFFSFLVSAFGCTVYGPVMGLLSGFAVDIIGVMLHPMGGFFFGYTISSMLGCFIYALFLYRRPLTLARLAGAKLAVNLLVNVGLGALWSAMLYGKAYYFYLLRSLTKNVLLWPVEAALLYLFFRAVLPQSARAGLTVQRTAALRRRDLDLSEQIN